MWWVGLFFLVFLVLLSLSCSLSVLFVSLIFTGWALLAQFPNLSLKPATFNSGSPSHSLTVHYELPVINYQLLCSFRKDLLNDWITVLSLPFCFISPASPTRLSLVLSACQHSPGLCTLNLFVEFCPNKPSLETFHIVVCRGIQCPIRHTL